MAQFDYLGTRATADRLIQRFGMAAVLRRTGSPDRPCFVAIIDNEPTDKATALTNPTDRRVLLSASGAEIEATPPDNESDLLVTFVQPPTNPPVQDEVLPFTCPVKKYAPAGIVVLYEFTVRR